MPLSYEQRMARLRHMVPLWLKLWEQHPNQMPTLVPRGTY